MTVNYNMTREGIVVLFGNALQYSCTVFEDNPLYATVLDAAMRGDESMLEEVLYPKENKAVIKTLDDFPDISVDGDVVVYKGVRLHNVLTKKIAKIIEQGYSAEGFVNFLKRLMDNPSKRAVDELYRFLEAGEFPITPTGHFIGYKGVRSNYKDCHTGTFDNSVGATPWVSRNSVDDDPHKGCSYGFHVGTQEYARGFGSRVMLVEVDPANVVCIPYDCNSHKMRCNTYRVVGEITENKAVKHTEEAMVTNTGKEADPYTMATEIFASTSVTEEDLFDLLTWVDEAKWADDVAYVNLIRIFRDTGGAKLVNFAIDQGFMEADEDYKQVLTEAGHLWLAHIEEYGFNSDTLPE